MINNLRLILLAIIVYMVHVDFIASALISKNRIGIYALAILFTAISYGGFRLVSIYFYLLKKSKQKNLYFIQIIQSTVLPCYLIYILGVPFLGIGLFELKYVGAMFASALLMFGLMNNILEYFWQRRGEYLSISDPSNVSPQVINKIEIQLVFFLVALPLIGRLFKFLYV